VISPAVYEPMKCAICRGDRFAHRRDNGECMAYERAALKPIAARTRQRAVPSAWVLR
jgi:hypothetical protein